MFVQIYTSPVYVCKIYVRCERTMCVGACVFVGSVCVWVCVCKGYTILPKNLEKIAPENPIMESTGQE